MRETIFRQVLDHFEWKYVAAGSVLYEEGEKDDVLYMITSGSVQLSKHVSDASADGLGLNRTGHNVELITMG